MAETPGAGPDPVRKRWLAWFLRLREVDLYKILDESRFFRPALLLSVAIAVGLLLTPDLTVHDYPVLEGTPAVENIKAPYELEVLDEESTSHLRDEATARSRRVFDFDVLLAEKTARRIDQAFEWMRLQLERADGNRQRLDDVLEESRPEFEKLLGITLKTDELHALKTARFSLEVQLGLRRLLVTAQAEPILLERLMVDLDRGRGIQLQRVPDINKPRQVIDKVEEIADLQATRALVEKQALRDLPEVAANLRGEIGRIAARLVEPSLSLNRAATEQENNETRLSVKPVHIAIKKGEMIIRDGERLTRRHLLILNALHDNGRSSSIVMVALGGVVLLLVLIVTAARFARGYGHRRLQLASRDLLLLAGLFVVGLGAARFWLAIARSVRDHSPHIPVLVFMFALPVAAGTMLVRLVLRAEVALLFALMGSLMLGLLVDGDRMLTIYALVGSVAATTGLRSISARSDLLRAGVRVGFAQMATALGIYFYSANTQMSLYSFALPAAFAGGVLSGFVTLSLTPLVELIFRYTTDLKLLELSNLNHPALKELIVQAPGSYHHSIIVGALVEAAAESIGANSLLARVMAYYHDLGKGCNPGYFIENQRSGQNPHDKLKPSMSAMVIRRHVTDGIELARRYGLGEKILAGIAEHHGNTLIHFFYHKAKEAAEQGETVSEAEYRYPGRKPQTREAALVMLGDAIEAASRSLADPVPARLQGLVNRIISHKFTDGQLEECDLTLRDLHTIAKSFSRVLNSIYHHRPEYPDILNDISGKKHHGDSDTKPSKRPEGDDGPPEDPPPDTLRRLGL